jgi:hypothetical protein
VYRLGRRMVVDTERWKLGCSVRGRGGGGEMLSAYLNNYYDKGERRGIHVAEKKSHIRCTRMHSRSSTVMRSGVTDTRNIQQPFATIDEFYME